MSRIKTLQRKLNEHNLDALLITSDVNRAYLTGFTGTAGMAVIGRDQAWLLTDFRYMEQAAEQVKECKIIEHKQSIYDSVSTILKLIGAEKLGFEKESVTYSQYELIQKYLNVTPVPTNGIVEKLRMIKTSAELEVMQEAARIADDAFIHIQSYIKPGVKEIDVANELEFFMRRAGATSSSFDIIVASGHRSALPHGVASDKVIQTGELVTLDYGAIYNGYCSDITRTFAVGDISEKLTDIYETVLAAQLLGVEGTKPGLTGSEADALTRNHINNKGYGAYFGHSTGHGLGMEVHEGPALSPRSSQILEPGMVVTVEPGIYIPNVGGCRIEDDIVITQTGNYRLTKSTKELIHLS